jgi:selenide,water dikinase
VLGQLPEITDPDVLVGTANADDAGVYRISDDTAVVFTADYFTPIVDDPYWFGAIAAANSLSDVYAMGGKPVVSLNLALFPGESEFFPHLKQIMQGGIDIMKEAGVSIIGGHTVKDKEPKYGFAILGLIHPDRILDNSMAKPGDALILTKRIGTGIVATGVKADMCDDEVIEDFTREMAMLNKRASEIMLEVGVSTSTDVTGFGLIGHLHEVLSASDCQARLYTEKVPFFEEAVKIADNDIIPGGTISNSKIYSRYVEWSKDVTDTERMLLNDAQTSGGLLILVPEGKKDKLVSTLEKENILAAHIGDVIDSGSTNKKRIFVTK